MNKNVSQNRTLLEREFGLLCLLLDVRSSQELFADFADNRLKDGGDVLVFFR